MASDTQSIGIASIVPMGNWSATTPYQKLNTVRYNGATYIAKKQNTGFQPTVTQGWQEVWQVLCYDGGSLSIPAMLDLFIPVGKTIPQYYGEPTPAEQFAGTSWEIDTTMQGRVLIGSGGGYTFGAKGGSADAVAVAHTHVIQVGSEYNMDTGEYAYGSSTTRAGAIFRAVTAAGVDGTGKNMPPYIVVNYWKRTA